MKVESVEEVNVVVNAVIHWIPRAIGFGIAGFCYFFMLEGFSPEFGWKGALSHFAQGTLLLVFALIAWKWGIIGASLYVALGLYVLLKWRKAYVIATVLGVTGLLFIFL